MSGKSRKTWFSHLKSGAAESDVGEVPEAANESCEDITPPSGEDAFEILGRTKVGFAPTLAVSAVSGAGTVAFSPARLPDG